MRKIVFLVLMISGLCAAVFAQEAATDAGSIVGTFRNDKEGTTFIFSGDGKVAMIGDPETARKAMEEERRRGGAVDSEIAADRLTGTWSVRERSVEIRFQEDGKDNKMAMTIVNNDTLRLGFLMFSSEYKRVQ
jgi:hypothetical protein